MVKVSTNSGRILRSTALPKQLLVSLNISTDQLITFDLKANGEINSNIPIYIADTDGKIRVQQIASLEVGEQCYLQVVLVLAHIYLFMKLK